MAEVEIGIGKRGRRAYGLREIAVVPSRRTRDPEDVDISWTLDAYRFDLPVLSDAADPATSPATAAEVGRLGGLGVLDLEGLWTRHEDPAALLSEVAGLPDDRRAARLRELHEAPIRADLIARRIAELKQGGHISAAALTPQSVEEWHAVALDAGLEVLVVAGVVVSAEHVSSSREPLNLKQFIARYDIPVVVGGCASYATALHLMRTGAAGVLVGVGSGSASTTTDVLGVGVPMATAIADAAAARSRHLEETGRKVSIIADGGIATGGDIARAIALGADAVVLEGAADEAAPACAALARSMGICGYPTLKEFQRAEVVVTG